MNNLFLYLAQAFACLLAFYGFYYLVLRQETGFQFNRAYLLLAPALSFLLPLLSLPQWLFALLFLSPPKLAASGLAEASFNTQVMYYGPDMSAAEPFNWEPVFWTIYGLGFCFFSYRLLRQLLTIRSFIRQYQADIIRRDGFKMVPTRGTLPTFSFLNYLFWDSSQAATEAEKQNILQHESVHIAQKHTWDILYLEILSLIFWFQPVLYLYKKALIHTHEYIADAEVIRTTNQEEYATLLVQQVFKKMDLSIGHFFNKSLTLKRMTMLQRNHLHPNRLKQVLALPLFMLLFFLVAAYNTSAGAIEDPAATVSAPEIQASAEKAALNPQQSQTNIPVFPGGKSALNKHLMQNTKYPPAALRNGITGQVIIQVTIDEQGRPGNFQAIQADHPSFAEEAIRVLKGMPDWQPANNKGKAEAFTLAFPFIFGMESNKQLPPLKVPSNNSRFMLQTTTTVVGYSQFIGGKTVTQTTAAPSTNPKATAVYPRSDKIFTFVEQQALFPGGDQAMNAFIRENLKYPAAAKKSGKEGLVVVQFVVDRNGNISDAAIVKSLGAGTDEEALRIVNLFPDFEPAKQNGKPVEFRFTLPFRFSLAQQEPANGYIPPTKTSPSGSYLNTLNQEFTTSTDCQPRISFIQNDKFIDLNKTRPTDDLKVAFAIPSADCPGKNYQIENINYYLQRDSGIEGSNVKVNSFNLNKLLSNSQPGDVLNIRVTGSIIPGKDGQASSPFRVDTVIPLK